MAILKTKESDASVGGFLASIKESGKRNDAQQLVSLMKKVTGDQPKMWGKSIVGFGMHHFTYESGREIDWFLTGFSPRKENLTVYLMVGFDRFPALMKRLGKYKTGKGCLYFKSLEDIDRKTLEALVKESVSSLKRKYGAGKGK